ncbi:MULTISPECIES: aromatic ring-hydroxylating dioxygenase subunit alpha [unclassified Mycobacterium]|uniref:aromatic ring-hydroxylating dioxygenase subunit alpha n=1 Tax=unclassified Mycobacterium TaxID=2642494 RepID=UPI0029C77219|nr:MULTISPECIES: aromatic ring-hydroxylating dioxygenase subunit alpha [unclassified Mycobacterium]
MTDLVHARTDLRGGAALVEDVARALQDGRMPAGVYNDVDIFEMEKHRIFRRSWAFLAHESEIPNPGDYVVRYIVDDSFIVVRDEHGEIRVLFNACRHRGMQVCRSEVGNASHFRCPYHAWTYKNDGALRGVPFRGRIYGSNLDRSQWGLMPIPRMDSYDGLIFGNLDLEAPSLIEYLGGAEWYLNFYTRRSAAGLEFVGAPQRWVVSADWKLATENFIGDAYHIAFSHRSTIDAGITAVSGYDFHLESPQWVTDRAGGGLFRIPPGSYAGCPPELVAEWKRNLDPDQLHMLEELSLIPSHGSIFPNLSFLNAPAAPEADGIPAPYTTFRVWQPVGPGRIEIWSWFAVEKEASQEFKDASRKAYTLSMGASGTVEQDDAENWTSITRVARGNMANDFYLNFSMGLNHLEPIPDWRGPGKAYPIAYTEFAHRQMWSTWLDYMTT